MTAGLRPAILALLGITAFASVPARAVDTVELSVGVLSGQGWRVESPRAVLELATGSPVLRLEAPSVVGDDGATLAGRTELVCRDVVLNASYLVCPAGELSLVLPPAEKPFRTSLHFVLSRDDGRWRAGGVAAPGEGLAWSARGGDGGIRAELGAARLALAELAPWLPALPGGIVSVSGEMRSLEASITVPGEGPVRARVTFEGSGLGFDSADGRLAAAGVSGGLQIDWQGVAGDWRADTEVTLESGEFLAGTFYTSVGGAELAAGGTLHVSGSEWRLQSFSLEDPEAVSLSGSARWDWSRDTALRDLDARLETLAFPGFYGAYLQPILAQYGFGNLATNGSMAGRVTISDGAPTFLSLSLNHMDVSDSGERLEFVDLNGELQWQASGEALASSITWQGGRIYNLPLGSADIRAEALADDFRLTRQTLLPVLDGALVINALEVEDWTGEQPTLLLDARLMPISLGALSGVLGWPELQGTLAGRIPELTLREGVYRLGGSLVVDVFDGTVLVENLRLERPFGVLPKMVADVRLNDLDLETLTGIFTIGRITGRLAGHVTNLRLLDWEPVHFDARLATPADDDSRHRISQRAVDTLTNLGGGGAGGALSRTFLRVFDEFAYEQIGITCRLENNVCHMGGVKSTPNDGYYIVQGAGLPRVDVIGHVRRVDWPRLVDQLIEAMSGQAPTVGQPPGDS